MEATDLLRSDPQHQHGPRTLRPHLDRHYTLMWPHGNCGQHP